MLQGVELVDATVLQGVDLVVAIFAGMHHASHQFDSFSASMHKCLKHCVYKANPGQKAICGIAPCALSHVQ